MAKSQKPRRKYHPRHVIKPLNVRNNWEIVGHAHSALLAPDLPLIFSGRRSGFALSTKKRRLETCEIAEYKACDALENVFRNLYRSAGLFGASSHSCRRYYATTLMRDGTPIETISHLLGHSHIDFTYPYLEPERESVIRAFEVAL